MSGVDGLRWARRCLAVGMMSGLGALGGVTAAAESCTTQSQMKAADRQAMVSAAQQMVQQMQAGDVAGLEGEAAPELRGDFAAVRQAVLETSGHLKGDTLAVDQVYLLEAAGLAAGSDAQFFCTLNRAGGAGAPAEVDFSIRGLSAGTYGFALVRGLGASPWRVSLLLERSGTRWLLAGFFPGPTEAAGHDGLWYWKEARQKAAAKQPWNAWLLYGEARSLLQPAGFVQTTHLQKLEDERKAAAPTALSGGLSAETPLVIKGPDGKEYRVTGLSVSPAAADGRLEVVAAVEGMAGDAAAVRAESEGAARALVAAYPELRSEFAGVLTSLELPGQNPFVTSRPMSALR